MERPSNDICGIDTSQDWCRGTLSLPLSKTKFSGCQPFSDSNRRFLLLCGLRILFLPERDALFYCARWPCLGSNSLNRLKGWLYTKNQCHQSSLCIWLKAGNYIVLRILFQLSISWFQIALKMTIGADFGTTLAHGSGESVDSICHI